MIPLLEPVIPQASKDYVNEAMDTGWLSYSGPYVKKLEDQVRKYTRTIDAVAASNGTGALWLILKALGIGSGDFVAVPTMTFVATVNAIVHAGATPVFIDCDDELQMCPHCLRQAKESIKLKAVIPVHMLGNPCDMESIDAIIDPETYLIEDSAQALGSFYLNSKKRIGSWGYASMFSFSFNKTIAAGQGGMITTNHRDLGKRLKYLSLQAKDDAEMYVHDESGFNMGMSNLNAALACGQMDQIDYIISEKRRVRDKYAELLGKENLYYQEEGNGWLNACRISRQYEEVSTRCKERGVQVRPLFYPNHLQKSFKDFLYFGNWSAEEKYEYTVCLPSSIGLTDEQIEYIVESVLI